MHKQRGKRDVRWIGNGQAERCNEDAMICVRDSGKRAQ